MININEFPNISELTDIEENFRVFAGPGAGKTTWLIHHLENVLKNSKRLGKTRKIACITYTNVAAEEILDRLQCDKSRFDISTIHSFLYRNIVKPFSYLIAKDENGEILFDINKLDGHDEHIPHRDRIRRWIVTIGQLNNKKYNVYNAPDNMTKVIEELASLDYSFVDSNVELIIRKKRGAKIPKGNGELWIYKKKYWHDGIMHYEDVLYFSYKIIKSSPRVLEFIRNKFPYIFIDEFQDTTELQTWIIKKIAEKETKVGIIGDLAQSIYKFVGAKRCDFENFNLEGIKSYKIEKNHRSTEKIIHFLNHLRRDITQDSAEDTIEGNPILVLIGPINKVRNWLDEKGFRNVFILTRKNEAVDQIQNQIGVDNSDLLKEYYASDSNSARVKVLHSILMGYKYYQKKRLKDAMKQILKPLKSKADKSISKLELRKMAIDIIEDLNDEQTMQKSLYDFYDNLWNKINENFGFQIGAKVTRGKVREFYKNNIVSDLLAYIKVDTRSDDTIRTIHSAKGTEFENVLVHFENLRDFENYVLNADNHLNSEEDDARIYYVAFSRAKINLFINIPNVPEVNQEIIAGIESIGIDKELILTISCS